MTIGIMVAIAGVLWVPFCLIMAVLTANPCGMMSDHCDEYGQTSDTATAFFSLMFLAVPVVIGGVVIALLAWRNRPQLATP